MQKLSLVTILLIYFTASQAQKHSFYGSLHAGLASSQGHEAKLSSGLGVELEARLSERFYIVARPTLNFRGYNANLQVNSVKATYLDFPVTLESLLGEPAKMNLFIGAGGYFGVALAGKYKTNLSFNSTEWQPLKIGESLNDNRSATDYGLSFNGGFRFAGGSRVIKMGVQTQWGLKNVVPLDAQDATNNNPIRLRNITAYLSLAIF